MESSSEQKISVDDRGQVKRIFKELVFDLLMNKFKDDYKAYRDQWHQSMGRQIKTEKPLQLSIEMTSFCNLQCRMCYRNYQSDKAREFLSIALVDKIVAQAKELNIPGIWIGLMTESLLHPDAETIIRKFADIGAMDYWFSTNGTLLNESISNALVDAQATVLTVSLDAATQETYKSIRGANLSLVTENIMRFIETRERRNSLFPRLRVSFVETDINRHEKEQFVNQWQGIADIIDFQMEVDTSLVNVENRDELIKNSTFHCSDPFSRILVKYDGELWPCCGTYQAKQKQNINHTSLLEFWNSRDIEDLRNSLKNKEFLSTCGHCALLLQFGL